MTLEDFFTLTEMKDGLTAPARVKQLVNVMHKEKYNIGKNVGDATRQWSTVASTIAATENKDCLDLFLRLDGLCYFDSWLKDAQKFGNEAGGSFVEESVTALLGAIEKLHIDDQKLVTSGILMTVKNLLSHNSSRVQDKARALFDSWKQNSDSNVVLQDFEKVEAVCEDQLNASANPVSEHEHLEGSSPDISPPVGCPKGSDVEEKNVEPARDEMMPSISSETVQREGVEDKNIQKSDKILDHASMKDGPPDPVCSLDMLKLVSENNSILEPQTHQSEVTTRIGSCGSAVPKQGTLEGKLDVANSNEYDDAKQTLQIRSCDKLSAMNTSFSADSTNALESKLDPDIEKDVTKVEEPCLEVFPSGDVRTDVSEGKGRTGDSISPNPCRNIFVSDDTGQIDECSTDVLHSSTSNHKFGNSEDPLTSLSKIEESVASEESNEHDDTDGAEDDLGNDSDFSGSAVNKRNPDAIERSDIELDYGAVDPLEVARQVAIEVEREVDCREPSCSSSEKTSGGGIKLPGSPDSINGKKGKVIHSPSKDVRTGSSFSAAVGDVAFINTENLITEQESCILDVDASRVTVAAQTLEPSSVKLNCSFDVKLNCSFDLNEEVLPDEMDYQINPIAAPISVVAASRAAAASALPVAPLQFEGTLGWKGSAETSAFRPAPSRRISEGEKSLFASGSHNSSRQRQDYLDIDLNVAESEDDKIAYLKLGKEIPNSVGPSYGEPSIDANPERSNRLQLDLNCVSDGGDVPSYWRKEGQLLTHLNGHHSPSHSSSSSSMQHSLRNIDLNDQPPLFSDFSDPANFGKSSQNLYPSRGFRPDASVISIMGARVEVSRNEFVPQTIPLANGRISDHVVDASSTRTGSVLGLGSTLPYTRSTVYGYNGPSSGPAIPFSSAMFGLGGHIPYMMDSRGSPVVPQILGSASSALPPAFSQPPFIMGMTGAPSGSNGVVPGMIMDGGNRDTGGLRQLFNSGQGRSIDEHMRSNSQPTSSFGAGGKRKETDGGWEPYPFNYKHHQPPWK